MWELNFIFIYSGVIILPHIVNMLLFHDNSVKLIPLLALFLVYGHLKHSRAFQLASRVMTTDLAIIKNRKLAKITIVILNDSHQQESCLGTRKERPLKSFLTSNTTFKKFNFNKSFDNKNKFYLLKLEKKMRHTQN